MKNQSSINSPSVPAENNQLPTCNEPYEREFCPEQKRTNRQFLYLWPGWMKHRSRRCLACDGVGSDCTNSMASYMGTLNEYLAPASVHPVRDRVMRNDGLIFCECERIRY